MSVGLGFGFMRLTVAELFGANAGLGRFVQYYADFADYLRSVAGILATGIVTWAAMTVLDGVRRSGRAEGAAAMKAFLRDREIFEDSIVSAAPDPRDQEEKERYVARQLWWALIGLALFALAMFFGWAGAQEAGGGSPNDALLFAPTGDLAAALGRARREGSSGMAVLFEREECCQCAHLKATTFRDEALHRDYPMHFVPVSLRADEPIARRDFAGKTTPRAGFANQQRGFDH